MNSFVGVVEDAAAAAVGVSVVEVDGVAFFVGGDEIPPAVVASVDMILFVVLVASDKTDCCTLVPLEGGLLALAIVLVTLVITVVAAFPTIGIALVA